MTTREVHRERTIAAIVDAAESLLRSGGAEALTAGAVAERVGLARNSLYRYVESMDDLRGRVVMRHFPDYLDHIQDAITHAPTREAALETYVTENLRIAAEENHGWMMELAQDLSPEAAAHVTDLHRRLIDAIGGILTPFALPDPDLAGQLIQGIISTGFTLLEQGKPLESVSEHCVRAARGVVGIEIGTA